MTVRLLERIGDLDSAAQRLIDRKRTLRQPLRERLAVEELHHEVFGPVLAADVVDGADVRVRELRDRTRFPLEALARLVRARKARRQNLDRDLAPQPCVPRPVDLS